MLGLPTVAVSSQISNAVYFASVFGLAVLLARPAYLVYSASQERGAQAVASGLAEAIDSMTSGTTMTTSLQAYPGVSLSVALGGTTVRASYGGSSASAAVRWELPRATLSPGEVYQFTLTGGEMEVAPARNG